MEIKIYIFAAVASMCCVMAAAQQRTVIAGLEGHTEYCSLVDEEGTLARMTDSISRSINVLRESLRTETADRAANSKAILRMEQECFDIRGRMAKLASRINSIEQEWILENLHAGIADAITGAGANPGAGGEAETHSTNLVYSSYFARGLDDAGLGELLAAQEAEPHVPRLVAQYRENQERMRVLASGYEQAVAEAADSIRIDFEALAAANTELAALAHEQWEKIFDSKSYAYNYLMDKSNRRDMLALYESGTERLRTEKEQWRESGASEAIVNFVLQKRMLTDYEIALAGEFGNDPATDSLQRVAAALPHAEELEEFEPVRLKERLFLDYSDVSAGQSPYNAANPIPEARVFPRGVIYRVLVGTYSAAQSPSVFRNIHPLAVQRGGDGKYRYFAGGFPSDSLATMAAERLRNGGFRSPAVAVWMDGVYIWPAAGEGEGRFYRLELSGTEELSAEARGIIGAASGDIVRGEGGLIVTPLGREEAMRLRLALERLEERDFEIKLAEISE